MTPEVPKPPSIPATVAECVSTVKLPSGAAHQNPIQWMRSDDGKLRLDFPNMSMINDPISGYGITLDHLKKEYSYTLLSPPPPPAMPAMPDVPAIPQVPAMDPSQVQDLGRAMVEGVEVLGKRYHFDMPDGPAVTDIWSDAKTKLPVLTQTTGTFGQQTCHCRFTEVNPPVSTFQIPGDYTPKVLPTVPEVPAAPAAPSAPQVPSVQAPSVQAPAMPSAPSVQTPQAPSAPKLPNVPKFGR